MSSRKICSKDNDKSAHWVGQSKLRILDINKFLKRTPEFDENQDIVTGNTEEEENVAEKTTYDADENVEANETIDKNKDKVVTIEEEKNTLEYQETMNLDIENMASTNQ